MIKAVALFYWHNDGELLFQSGEYWETTSTHIKELVPYFDLFHHELAAIQGSRRPGPIEIHLEPLLPTTMSSEEEAFYDRIDPPSQGK